MDDFADALSSLKQLQTIRMFTTNWSGHWGQALQSREFLFKSIDLVVALLSLSTSLFLLLFSHSSPPFLLCIIVPVWGTCSAAQYLQYHKPRSGQQSHSRLYWSFLFRQLWDWLEGQVNLAMQCLLAKVANPKNPPLVVNTPPALGLHLVSTALLNYTKQNMQNSFTNSKLV